MTFKNWHWPTEAGWVAIVVLSLMGFIAGGWGGLLIMLGFFAFVNVIGQAI